MSNTKTAKSRENGTVDEPTAEKTAQQAQIDEAAGKPTTVEFEGHTYELLEGQPSPRAMTLIGTWQIDEEPFAAPLACRELIGSEAWNLWCTRHKTTQIQEFLVKVGNAAGGNS